MNGNGLPELVPGFSESHADSTDCGCCEGLDLRSPLDLYNRPSLTAIAYRVGRHGDFKRSMLARLSSAELPALAGLKTRDDDDFSIALIDAWSTVCDVLTFYQERHANEAYLGTATERLSLVELGRLIGYRLKPGVAAGTELAFVMEDPPGAPEEAIPETNVPEGTRVQSVPGPGESAQIFETVEELDARLEWNAIPPRQTRLVLPDKGDIGTYLRGIETRLSVGDAIIIVGRNRAEEYAGSEFWDFRKLTKVEPDADRDLTWIEWTHGLGSIQPPHDPAQKGQRIYALRARASLFGYNAPHPNLLSEDAKTAYTSDIGSSDWLFDIDISAREIRLDGIYPTFVSGSWIAVTRPTYVELYRITEAADSGFAKYAVSGRSTRLTLDTAENLGLFEDKYRKVSVYGQSEELLFAESPITTPVGGDAIELAMQAEDLPPGRRLIVKGRRAQVRVLANKITVESDLEPGVFHEYEEDTRLTLLTVPIPLSDGSGDSLWYVEAPGGATGFVITDESELRFVPAEKSVETIAETALLESVEAADETHSILNLELPLEAAFDRESTVVHANVAAATHGESGEEILGGGDASRPYQSFTLAQTPLTHVSAATETGTESTLEVRVDDVRWEERPFLYGAGPRDRVYTTRRNDADETLIQFGDGRQGARPPSGENNIVASYRVGIGREGSVDARSLTLPLDKPLGLKEVLHPVPAGGGDDPERTEDARENAPITTLTLGRVVSLKDYEDFARGFAGIAKARANWSWDGDARRILVTVAGPDGEAVDPDAGDTFENLLAALRGLGDPFVRVDVKSYRPATFRLKLRVKVHADYLADLVLPEVEARLREAYSFDARGFTRLVSLSEVVSIVHEVDGVEAVDVDRLYRTAPPNDDPTVHDRLLAQLPVLEADGELSPAEILTLDEGPLDGLEELS